MRLVLRSALPLVALLMVPALHADDRILPNSLPVYIATLKNPNDYTLFANGGWDGNWYVGYNTCWVKKLPPMPEGVMPSRAYIGAKLGRMKSMSIPGQPPWVRQAIPGRIFMAISSTSSWKSNQTVEITETAQLPLEPDFESALEGVGESQWFWAEIPLEAINRKGDNFLALWSDTPEFIQVSSAPILASGWGGKEKDTWLLTSIKGKPPETPANLGSPISYFQPAMVLKLIPKAAPQPLTIRIVGWSESQTDRVRPVITTEVAGNGIEKVHIEVQGSSKKWTPTGQPKWHSPYTFTLEPLILPKGKISIRAVATNIWGDTAATPSITIEVGLKK